MLERSSRSIAGIGAALSAAVVVVSLGLVSHRYASRESRAAGWVEHTHAVVEALTLAKSSLSEAESAVRGRAASGDTSLLRQAEGAIAKAQAEFRHTRELTRDNFSQQHRLDELDPMIWRRIELLHARLTALGDAQPDPGITPEALRLSDDIRSRVDVMIGQERGLLVERSRARENETRIARWWSLGGSFVAAVLVLVAGFLLVRVRSRGDRAERDLRAKHKELQAIVEGTSDAVYSKDLVGRFILVNSACAQVIGRPAAAILGTTVADFLPPDIAAAISGNDQDVLRLGATRTIEEIAPVAGVNRTFLSTKSPLLDEENRIVGLVGISRDITELREAEAARRADSSLHLRLSELLQAARTVDEGYDVIRQMAPRFFQDCAGAVYLVQDSRDHLEAQAWWGRALSPEGSAFGPDDCWALRRGRAYGVDTTEGGMRCKHALGSEAESMLCVPLLAQGEMLGILHLRTEQPLTSMLRNRANLVSEQLAMGLANLRLRETLRNQAIRDPLTGLFNRRYTEETLTRELRRAQREGAALAVLAIDVDHFKRFNDTFGHEAGDQVLRAIGGFLREQTRVGDVASRMGGEELLILLPRAGLEAALQKAERLRQGISQLTVTHLGRSIGPVTISIGVAEFSLHATGSDELLRAADLALYEAKRQGRDRVVAAKPIAPMQTHEAAAANDEATT